MWLFLVKLIWSRAFLIVMLYAFMILRICHIYFCSQWVSCSVSCKIRLWQVYHVALKKKIYFSLFQHGSLAEYSKNKYQFHPCKTWKREATVGFLKWQKAVRSLPMHLIFLINVLIRSWPKGTSEKKKDEYGLSHFCTPLL